ncbi:class I SAM-dependent methyltransferase [Gordonia sp. CPCC 205515]|uniref:class I SAM-dependent methyltransferase n=1 Tax=Gordonia sp. CPCC 205515 TaxID=3140791 RepID=UPI003AF38716
MTATHTTPATPTADAFAERIFTSALATAEFMSIYLGERLGWYRTLADDGPLTADDLAARTGTAARYAREWLEMQAAYGILDVDAADDPARFGIAPGVAEVLTDGSSLNYLGELPRIFAAPFTRLPQLLEAYRRGGGVGWGDLGDDAREAQAALNRPWFEQRLAADLARVDHLHRRMSLPRARILDIGCGGGHSTVALARAYPDATVVGVDIDEQSVQMARRHAAAAGVADRVRLRCGDAAQVAADGPFDAAFAFECLHDLPRPVEVLGAVRAALHPGCSLIVMDEAVSSEFTSPAGEVDRLMYGFSVFVCLPDSMSTAGSAATGTVMRPATVAEYAHAAGFGEVRALPIDGFAFFRFYELSTHWHIPGSIALRQFATQ